MDIQVGQTTPVTSRPTFVLRLLLLIVPLAIGLAWGSLNDCAYVSFRCAHNLATGGGLTYDAPPMVSGAVALPPVSSPLYVLVLWLPAALGMPLPQIGLILSALGWGVTALAIYDLCRAVHRPVAAVVSATLVACSPAFIPALGTEVACTVALAWVAVALAARGRWRLQAVVLVLMLGTRLELSTLATALLLLGTRWIVERRFRARSGLALAAVALAWGALAALGIAAPLSFHLDSTRWVGAIEQLVHESEFYWLFLPAIGAGLYGLRTSSRTLWVGLPWIAIILLSGDAIAGVLATTLGLLLSGMGIDALLYAILNREAREPGRHLHRLVLTTGVALIVASPLAIAQVSSLVHHYRLRPIARQALQKQAGDWLRAHSQATATVLGSARTGYLADRSTLPWNGDASDTAKFARLVQALAKSPPEYCVPYDSLSWDRLIHTAWFQDDYVLSATFESPYDATSPYTVWRYAQTARAQPVEASFGDQIGLLSFGAAESVAPGESLAVRLYWTARRPLTEDYIVFVHLLDGKGERVTSYDSVPRGRTSPTSTWLPGDVVPDALYLPIAPDIPVGTYQLWVGIYTWPDMVRLPVWDREGIEQVNSTLFLSSIQVPSKGK